MPSRAEDQPNPAARAAAKEVANWLWEAWHMSGSVFLVHRSSLDTAADIITRHMAQAHADLEARLRAAEGRAAMLERERDEARRQVAGDMRGLPGTDGEMASMILDALESDASREARSRAYYALRDVLIPKLRDRATAAESRLRQAEREREQRCIKHAAYNAEGDCVFCDKEAAEARAQFNLDTCERFSVAVRLLEERAQKAEAERDRWRGMHQQEQREANGLGCRCGYCEREKK